MGTGVGKFNMFMCHQALFLNFTVMGKNFNDNYLNDNGEEK